MMHNLRGYLLFLQTQVLLIQEVFSPISQPAIFGYMGISVDNNKLLLKYVISIQGGKKYGLSIIFMFSMACKNIHVLFNQSKIIVVILVISNQIFIIHIPNYIKNNVTKYVFEKF